MVHLLQFHPSLNLTISEMSNCYIVTITHYHASAQPTLSLRLVYSAPPWDTL